MIERGWAWSRGLWAATGSVAVASAPLAGCTSSPKPPGDTLSAGDASMQHLDAASQDTAAPPLDSTAPPPDAAGSTDSGSNADSPGGSGCDAGLTFCGGGCTDTKKDPSNCGQCSNACGSTFFCVGGQCLCPTGGGQAICNNTCVNIATDPSNCGACGHSCQGGMCAGSLCQPTVIATVTGAPIEGLAVDSANIYWTQLALSMNPGAASKKPFAGSMTTLTIANPPDLVLSNPRGIAVDNLNMYWVDVGNGAIERSSLDTQSYRLLRSPLVTPEGGVSDSPYDIVSDGTNIYWVTFDGGQVISEPIGGGTETVIATGENHPRAIALDASNVYWIDFGNANATTPSGSVRQVSKAAPSFPATPHVLAQNEDQPWSIAVDETSVYWTDHANPGQVRKVPIGGGPIVTLAPLPGSTQQLGAPYGIAVDQPLRDGGVRQRYVYWTNFNDNTVMRLPLDTDGGQQPFVLASGLSNPAALAVTQENVFWVNQGAMTILQVVR